MVILKLNRIASLIILMLLFSCKKTAVKNDEDDPCEVFVAGKKGFWINLYSKGLQENSVIFRLGNKEVLPKNKETGTGHINYFIDESLQLKDTITIDYKGKGYKIYDFRNLRETAIDGRNHKEIEICRVSTARINGKPIQDSRNNILRAVLE